MDKHKEKALKAGIEDARDAVRRSGKHLNAHHVVRAGIEAAAAEPADIDPRLKKRLLNDETYVKIAHKLGRRSIYD